VLRFPSGERLTVIRYSSSFSLTADGAAAHLSAVLQLPTSLYCGNMQGLCGRFDAADGYSARAAAGVSVDSAGVPHWLSPPAHTRKNWRITSSKQSLMRLDGITCAAPTKHFQGWPKQQAKLNPWEHCATESVGTGLVGGGVGGTEANTAIGTQGKSMLQQQVCSHSHLSSPLPLFFLPCFTLLTPLPPSLYCSGRACLSVGHKAASAT
jgi:hypothetical protein